jgi:hypothetical protein
VPLQAGADKTLRLWDAHAARAVCKFVAGGELEDTQVGCSWLGRDTLAAVSLGGDIRLFDARMAKCHTHVIGHQRSITAMASAGTSFWTADYGGRALECKLGQRCADRMPPAHTNSVVGVAVCGPHLVSAGLDDKLRCTPIAGASETARAVALPCAPKAMGVSAGGVVVLATVQGVSIARDGVLLSSAPLEGALAAAITPDGREVAIGCEDGRIHVFSVAPTHALSPLTVLTKHRGAVTALAFHVAGADTLLASCDANREVVVWQRQPAEPYWAVKVSKMVYHTARVSCLAWSPDGRLASGGAFAFNPPAATAGAHSRSRLPRRPRLHRDHLVAGPARVQARDDPCRAPRRRHRTVLGGQHAAVRGRRRVRAPLVVARGKCVASLAHFDRARCRAAVRPETMGVSNGRQHWASARSASMAPVASPVASE